MALEKLPVKELLRLHAHIFDQLRSRGILSGANSLTGDVADFLFCRAFGWTPTRKPHTAADAIAPDGTLFKIKGCRIHRTNASRQLTLSPNLPESRFSFLAAVLFEQDYSVRRGAFIPYERVLEKSSFSVHLKSWMFPLHDHVWEWPEVRDVTIDLRRVSL